MTGGRRSNEILNPNHNYPSAPVHHGHHHGHLHQHDRNNISFERQPSMSVGYLTRTPHNQELHSYNINNSSSLIYSSQTLMQPQQQHNIPQQPPKDSYDRPTSGPSHPGSGSTSSTTASPHTTTQTPRITLPPLSAITENQENPEGPNGQTTQTSPVSPAQTSYAAQQQQQQHSTQQQPPPSISQPPQPSQPYPVRPVSQYEPQQGPYPHPARRLQPSPQLGPDQTRYSSGSIIPQSAPVPPHQMPLPLQSNPQIGQFSSPAPPSAHFQSQSQYPYPQSSYPPQLMYGQYPPPPQLSQMPPGMPPGIPYQPAYATSHRQRPPSQYNPYPPGAFAPPPPGAPQTWPSQDYVAQPLTSIPNHSSPQSYSPQVQQMPGQAGPMRIRRTPSGLPQPPYPPPPPDASVQGSPQQTPLKPKRKRATSGQLRVLNSVFASTFFPSTELRIALGKELNMSPRTVQIWFQNKRQSWRANKAKGEHSQPSPGQAGTPGPSGTFPASGGAAGAGHPLRQEHYPSSASSPGHGRGPSAADDSAREEGMENDEGGGWEALRQAQATREYHHTGQTHDQNDITFDEGAGIDSPHHRHR